MTFEYPANLADLRHDPGGEQWVRDLPTLVRDAANAWNLRVSAAYSLSHVSYTAPAVTLDGDDVVLKVQFPHRESEHEAEALRVWDGDGAVRLLAHDAERHVLLLERCIPGDSLQTLAPNDAVDVYCDLLPRLWKPTDLAIGTLAKEAEHWADTLVANWKAAGRSVPEMWIERGVELCRSLGPAQREAVLLHQDLHADNVLRAQREPWLVIDPKPLLGEREFSVASIVRSNELGHSRAAMWHRFDRLCDGLNLDRDRAWGWTFAQTLAWGLDASLTRHHDTLRWLLNG